MMYFWACIALRLQKNLLGDNLSDVDGASSGGGVKSGSRGRGGESSDGGNGELHFDGVGLAVVFWEKRREIKLLGWLLKRV